MIIQLHLRRIDSLEKLGTLIVNPARASTRRRQLNGFVIELLDQRTDVHNICVLKERM